MSDPATLADFERRFKASLHFEGRGEDTRMVVPCPFCAAPDFQALNVRDSIEGLARGATCGECGRSARWEIEQDGILTEMVMVQTGGPDAPPYLPAPRREAA